MADARIDAMLARTRPDSVGAHGRRADASDAAVCPNLDDCIYPVMEPVSTGSAAYFYAWHSYAVMLHHAIGTDDFTGELILRYVERLSSSSDYDAKMILCGRVVSVRDAQARPSTPLSLSPRPALAQVDGLAKVKIGAAAWPYYDGLWSVGKRREGGSTVIWQEGTWGIIRMMGFVVPSQLRFVRLDAEYSFGESRVALTSCDAAGNLTGEPDVDLASQPRSVLKRLYYSDVVLPFSAGSVIPIHGTLAPQISAFAKWFSTYNASSRHGRTVVTAIEHREDAGGHHYTVQKWRYSIGLSHSNESDFYTY